MTPEEYWQECIAQAAEECGVSLTPEQLATLAGHAQSGHEHYGQAFYLPPSYEGTHDACKQKIRDLERDLERMRSSADRTVARAMGLQPEDVVVTDRGEVIRRNDSVTILGAY